jgi:hypothetical protein
MISNRPCRFEVLLVLAVLAASPAAAQSDMEHMHHHHADAETMPKAGGAPARLPPLKILMPENGATIGTRMAIVIQTPADLSKMTMGAPVMGTHLHIEARDVSMMPSREQLVRLGPDRYVFLFDVPAKPGENTLRVYWADAQHRTVPDSVQQVTVTVARDAAQ